MAEPQVSPSSRGPTRGPTESPIRRWRVAILALAAVIGVLGVVGYLGYRAANRLEAQLAIDLSAGQRELEAGKVSLKAANAERSLPKIVDAEAHFGRGIQHFAAAEGDARASRLLNATAQVPILGGFVSNRLTSARGIATMGKALGQAGSSAARVDQLLIAPPSTGKGLARLLTVLTQSQPDVASLRRDLVTAGQAAETVSPGVLNSNQRSVFLGAKKSIATGLAGVAEFQRLTPALVDILGGNGTRTYLVEQVNPAELRSGGGFVGTVSVLKADHGNLGLTFSGDTYTFDGSSAADRPTAGQTGYVPPPVNYLGDFFARTWTLEDSNFFPSFATNAKWGEFFAHAHGVQAQGVIAMDYYAVASMLTITGPIAVPEYGVTFDSKNFVNEVFQRSLIRDPNHKSVLAAAAGPLIGRLSTLSPEQWPKLAEVMNAAIASRHLQVDFNDAAVENEMVRFGWSAGVNPAQAKDFILETEDNFGGNKTNHFIARHYNLTLTKQGNQLHHTITIDLADNAPQIPDGNFYSAYLRLYTTARAANLKLSLTPASGYHPVPAPGDSKFEMPTGIQMAHARFLINVVRGQAGHQRITIDYDQPWTPDQSGAHEIYWQKQPGTLNDTVDITWIDGAHTYRTTGDLGGDRLIKLSAAGIKFEPAQSATAHLPQLGF